MLVSTLKNTSYMEIVFRNVNKIGFSFILILSLPSKRKKTILNLYMHVFGQFLTDQTINIYISKKNQKICKKNFVYWLTLLLCIYLLLFWNILMIKLYKNYSNHGLIKKKYLILCLMESMKSKKNNNQRKQTLFLLWNRN